MDKDLRKNKSEKIRYKRKTNIYLYHKIETEKEYMVIIVQRQGCRFVKPKMWYRDPLVTQEMSL
jgi:hypothetical protein